MKDLFCSSNSLLVPNFYLKAFTLFLLFFLLKSLNLGPYWFLNLSFLLICKRIQFGIKFFWKNHKVLFVHFSFLNILVLLHLVMKLFFHIKIWSLRPTIFPIAFFHSTYSFLLSFWAGASLWVAQGVARG